MEKILKTLGSTFLCIKDIGFVYGIQGILLRKNLEKYWYQHCITKSNYNIFYLPSNLLNENIQDICDAGLDNVPFGIAEFDYIKNNWNESYFPSTSKNIFHKIASVTTIYDSEEDIHSIKDLFYTKQRERKSWWRKISQNPSIYHLSEVKKDKGSEYVDIEARFSFGNIIIERIQFKKNAKKYLQQNKDTSNLSTVQYITSLDWGSLTLICDAFTEINGSKELQLYPQLAPYKAYFQTNFSASDNEKIREDLTDLMIYLNNKLREKNIETIILKNVNNPKIFQVPFIISVDNNSLKTGIVKLISQRTLIGESVHVTHLVDRILKYCI